MSRKPLAFKLITHYSSLITFSSVRVHPRQEVADAEVGEDDEEERDDGEVGRRAPLPAARDAYVEEAAVSQERDERAGLLRVPLPVVTPRLVRPHRARHQQERETGESDAAGLVHQAINLLLVGERRAQSLRVNTEDDDEERARERSDERREFDRVRVQAQEHFALILVDVDRK